MAHICVDGLLALTTQGLFPFPTYCCLLSSNVLENCSLFFEVMLNFAEFLTFGYGDQEAGVLIQAIMSIKSIIKQDPPSHEKVSFSCLFHVKLWLCVSAFLSVYFG